MPKRPLVAAILVNNQHQIVEWSRAPYTIKASGVRTDWIVSVDRQPQKGSQSILKGIEDLRDETDRFRSLLVVNPKTITQIPLVLPPRIHTIGTGECLVTFWGSKIYEDGEWFG